MNIDGILTQSPIMPVLVIEDAEDAVPLAEALKAGGLNVLEVTLRTASALDAIKNIATQVEGVIVGAGTAMSENDLKAVVEVGGQFAISPGATPALLKAGQTCGIPYLPAISTVSELMLGLEHGYQAFKFFPAEACGGIKALKSFYGPFPEITFCPTGGISGGNYVNYLSLPNVPIIGGSWIVPQGLLKAKDWQGIQQLAQEAVDSAKEIQGVI